MHAISGKVAIAGVGYAPFSKNSGVTTLTLGLKAIMAALDDAGLSARDVQGVATHKVSDGPAPQVIAQSLGITDLRYFIDQFGGGGSSHATVLQAASAIACGFADVVVCVRALNARSGYRMGGTGSGPVMTPEMQYLLPHGYFTPPQQYAMVARSYMAQRGYHAEHLAAVAMTERGNALLNERAMMRTPMTREDYFAAPMVAEPFRLFDCCLETDGAVALVLCTRDRARDLSKPAVVIDAGAYGGGQSGYSIDIGPDVSGSSMMAKRLFAMSDLGPDDIDIAMLYDAFTFMVLMQLEDYGFCDEGAAGDFVLAGNIARDGRLPVNTHGGFLSEGYAHGLNHITEAVQQLRGECGPRQVDGARTALSTGAPGFVGGVTSSLILRREA